MPYTTDPALFNAAFESIPLLNPTLAGSCGPVAAKPLPPDKLLIQSGLLKGWTVDGAARLQRSGAEAPLELWDVAWGEQEEHWARVAATASFPTPEDVESLLPKKWFGFRVDTEVDERLARVCKLCTALVDKYIAFSSAAASGRTTAAWRRHEALRVRISAVTEMLESSLDEFVPLLSLKDPNFVVRCWNVLDDDDRQSMVEAVEGANADATMDEESTEAA